MIITGCATKQSVSLYTLTESQPDVLIVPAGVDSTTAAEAKAIAELSFVSIDLEERSEELKEAGSRYKTESEMLWDILSIDATSDSSSVDPDDPNFINAFNAGAEQFIEMRGMEQKSATTFDDAKYAQLLDLSITSFEEALRANPFDAQTRLLLGQLYGVKASRLNRAQDFESAIDILEKLSRLEKGDHVIFSVLGENYFLVKRFDLAARNFEHATELLLATSQLTDIYYDYGHIAADDSLSFFTYLFYAGQSYTNINDSENAISAFERASKYTSTDEQRLAIDGEIQFIQWDEGNIQASVKREQLVGLANSEKLTEAEQGFRELLTTLKTQKAKDEIDWRLAVVEYQLEKTDASADRLLKLVQRVQVQADGKPIDPEYQKYFNDFGVITYNIGLQQLNKKNRSLALTYLMQSSKVHWNLRARSYLRIADLLVNNVPEAIRFAHLAEDDVKSLSEGDSKALYRLLSELYRRSGKMDEARRYFAVWRGLS
jgi:tetratricopeptide (TPR) repeat protein